MKNNFHVFLGATIGDAAARPLHWVYDQKKVQQYIKNKRDFAFLKNNKSPFYNIKTGNVSGYNDVGQVMFKTLISRKPNIEAEFKKKIIKHFGPGSNYWKNLKIRNKYKKIKWKKPLNGPWIHQNVLDTIKNIKSNKKITGGTKVNESDGFCAALPYYLYFNDLKNIKKIISLVCSTKISIKYGLAKLHIIDFALKKSKNPINSFIKSFSKIKYFEDVIRDIKTAKKLLKYSHNFAAKKFGLACSYPGNFKTSIHAILKSNNYKNAILRTIRAGGCNCSRSNFVGAYFAAFKGIRTIPDTWVSKCIKSKQIINHLK
jgi:hypothetical protein